MFLVVSTLEEYLISFVRVWLFVRIKQKPFVLYTDVNYFHNSNLILTTQCVYISNLAALQMLFVGLDYWVNNSDTSICLHKITHRSMSSIIGMFNLHPVFVEGQDHFEWHFCRFILKENDVKLVLKEMKCI